MKIVCLLLLFPAISMGQVKTNTLKNVSEGLRTGDTVPNFVISNILNYSSKELNLASFNKKLLVIDFFATWCSSCIKHLPKLDSLQKEYGDRIEIVLVTHEARGKVEGLAKKNKIFASTRLPIIYQDSLFKKIFPHRIIPHQVWLNGSLEVIGSTYAEYLTRSNLEKYFERGKILLPIKNDNLVFNKREPLLDKGNGGDLSMVKYRSLLTGYLPGVGSGGGIQYNEDSTAVRVFQTNKSILGMYAYAFNYRIDNRIVLEVKDSSKYIWKEKPWHEWALSNTYGYELIVPGKTHITRIKELMLQDLNRYLRIDARLEKRRVKCWVLECSNKGIKSVVTKSSKANLEYEDEWINIKNLPISKLLKVINTQPIPLELKPIVVDETGYREHVDMRLKSSIRNMAALKKELNEYGFDLSEAEREMEVLVISEIDQQQE